MPTSRLVFKLIRLIFEVTVVFFAIVIPVINDNFGNMLRKRCLDLDLNILIVMLETELGFIAITEIIPFENWLIYRS